MRTALAILVGLLLLTTKAYTQHHKAEIGCKFGVNVANLSMPSNNSISSAVTGLHAGLYIKIPLRSNFSLRPELYYSGQGQVSDFRSPPNGPSVGVTTTTINYINIPLMLEWGRKVSFQFGPQFGIVSSAKEVGTINNIPVNSNIKAGLPPRDFSLVGGVSVRLNKRVYLGLRYHRGFTNIVPQTGGVVAPAQNRVIHIYVGYSF